MKLSLCIPVMNQINDTKGVWGAHVENLGDKENSPELVVINNGSTDGTVEFLEKFIFPHFKEHKLVNNPENVGVVKSMNQCISESTGDVIAILHNDLYVYDDNWDERVLEVFEGNEKIGLAGFFGARGTYTNGGRMDAVSNMIEAEYHGTREDGNIRVGAFDGLSLIGRRTMFEQVGGFDEKYVYHHFYDRDISLASHFAGWENWLIGVYCHHVSGITANRPDYQTWIDEKMKTTGFTGDLASYKASEDYFFSKWLDKLPVYIK